MIANFKGNAYRWSLLAGVVIFLVGFVALTDAATIGRVEFNHAQAELMGRVEHFFMNNFRDVTWRKSVEWGQVSGAGVIVEASFQNMKPDPSQGAHFFHNLISFGVFYMTVRGKGSSRVD